MSDTEFTKDAHVEAGDPKADDISNKDESIECAEQPEVHSANAWENVDLGDEDRNNKFLRLLGAGKKLHQGRIIIGDHNPDHVRNSKDTEKIQHELLDQFEQSIQHRLAGGRRGHIGLGYHDTDTSAPQDDGDKADHGDEQEEEEKDLDRDSGDSSRNPEAVEGQTKTAEGQTETAEGQTETAEGQTETAEGQTETEDEYDEPSAKRKTPNSEAVSEELPPQKKPKLKYST